jgi:hypothetical protein
VHARVRMRVAARIAHACTPRCAPRLSRARLACTHTRRRARIAGGRPRDALMLPKPGRRRGFTRGFRAGSTSLLCL